MNKADNSKLASAFIPASLDARLRGAAHDSRQTKNEIIRAALAGFSAASFKPSAASARQENVVLRTFYVPLDIASKLPASAFSHGRNKPGRSDEIICAALEGYLDSPATLVLEQRDEKGAGALDHSISVRKPLRLKRG